MLKMLPLLLIVGNFASAKELKVDELYANYCSGCHGKKFEGGQGGVLVDGVWKHGDKDEDLYRSIAKGNLQLGMTPWEGILSSDQIRSLIIFLREQEKKTLTKGLSFPVPSPDKVTKTELHDYRIETLPHCVDADHPHLYPEPITAHGYLQQRLREIGLA